jgi:D-alanyl-D-alanine carboxypeptidase
VKKIKLKKNVKMALFILLGIVILSIITVFAVKKIKEHNAYTASYEYKFLEIGYNAEEVEKLLTLDKDLKDTLLKEKYNPNILKFVSATYFLKANLNKYLSYYEENEDMEINKIVAIINVGADKDHYEGSKETKTRKDSLMLVNKYHYLPANYEAKEIVDVKNWYCYGENKLSNPAYQAFIGMFNAAKEDDITIIISSGYRTQAEQQETYDEYVDRYGQNKAETLAARPGYSEHELGLSLDVSAPGSTSSNFDTSDAFRWLSENAYKYGFILRYPENKEDITGYAYESWHYRYVGEEVATKIHELDITFDEYYAFFLA